MKNIELLSKICSVAGAPGHEKKIRDFIIGEIKKEGLSYTLDNIGNLIVTIKGKKEKSVMVAAHMDEIGFIVKHIDEKGFVFFHPLGGFDPKTLTSQRVVIHGTHDVLGVMGSKPIHIMSAEDRKKTSKIEDYFIDTGLKKEELEKKISVGDPITRYSELIELGQNINGKSLDNRASVFVLLQVLKKINQPPPYDIYGVFTVQEEVGLRGASAASLLINPDFGFGLDTTIAFDTPGSAKKDQVSQLGNGPCIKIMDSQTICDYRMVNYMKEISKLKKIKTQLEILPAGATDTSPLQRMNSGGSIAGAISIPTRHIHQTIEMVNKSDLSNTILFLYECLMEMDKFDWSH